MRTVGCLLAVLLAAVAGVLIYRSMLTDDTGSTVSPEERVDTVRVQTDLLGIGRAERTYLVKHGRYGTVEELYEDGAISFSGKDRGGYDYTSEIDGDKSFRITASPSDPTKKGWPTFSIDESMHVLQTQ
jgi:hypothetical protein